MTKGSRARTSTSAHAPSSQAMGSNVLSQEDLARKKFANTLRTMLVDKNLTPADVSRNTGLGRDSLSRYLDGRTTPKDIALKKLATFLRVKPSDLWPEDVRDLTMLRSGPVLEMKQADDDPRMVWLTLHQVVDMETASKIFELIRKVPH